MRTRLRVAMHVHSTWSYDGRWSLSKIARVFGRLGYDAVMMTEHDTRFPAARFDEFRAECAAASTERCRLVPGIEYSDAGNDVHILSWGVGRFMGERRPVLATLRDIEAEGGIAVLAHPVRRDAWRLFDESWVPHLFGVEIWNRKADGIAPGSQALRLQAETGLRATVGVDFHIWKQIYPLDNLVTLDAAESASAEGFEGALLSSIRKGALVPRAFQRALVAEGGGVRLSALKAHQAFEAVRRKMRGALRPSRKVTE